MAAFLTYESAANKVADWIPYLEDCKKTRFIDPASGKEIRVGVEVGRRMSTCRRPISPSSSRRMSPARPTAGTCGSAWAGSRVPAIRRSRR